MWTLILVLVIVGPPGSTAAAAASVGHVAGFEDEAACLAAGKAWREMATPGTYRSLCVKLRSP